MKDYEGYQFCLKERQDGSAILYTQDFDDCINGIEGNVDLNNTVSVYCFDAENWKKLKELLNDEDPANALYHKFFWIESVVGLFLRKEFRSFCKENEIDFKFKRSDSIWFRPDKETFGAAFEHLCMYERSDGYKIPDSYPDLKYPQLENGYWPIRVDMKNKVMKEVQGVMPCAAYCSNNAILTFKEIEGFYL